MSHLSRRTLFQATAGAALLPALGVLRTASAAEIKMNVVQNDAWGYFLADPRFNLWIRLISAGGLESGVRGNTPFTVFAPTDDALAKFPDVARLLAYQMNTGSHNSQDAFPDTSKIVQLVRSHVVLGKHYPKEATGGVMTVTSLAGTPISVDTGASPVTVTWNSPVGGAVTGSLTDTPIDTFNAVIYPVSTIATPM